MAVKPGQRGAGQESTSLSVDEEAARRLLVERVTDDELQRVLAWHTNVDADNLRFGAMLIDASRPVADVVDHLLTELDLPLWPDPT
jgi:hypothetical protein